jgi:Raf kinase inhibitor-like YbhB/YbcL family protein
MERKNGHNAMKTVHPMRVAGVVIMLLAVAATGLAQGAKEAPMKISSPDFNEGGSIPSQFTCTGANVNPSLRISGVPAGAKSLVLIVDDPDAPSGTWTHWLIWNLKPDLQEIASKSVPAGAVQGANDFHKSSYGGPCPPSGTHRYFFRLLALDTVLELPAGSNRKALDRAMSGHVAASAVYMGKYAKPR